MGAIHCSECKEIIGNDEIALTLKLFGKQVSSVLCYRCMSKVLYCEVSELQERAEFFKTMGCELFRIDYTNQKERVEK